jgi:hypothetical protein
MGVATCRWCLLSLLLGLPACYALLPAMHPSAFFLLLAARHVLWLALHHGWHGYLVLTMLRPLHLLRQGEYHTGLRLAQPHVQFSWASATNKRRQGVAGELSAVLVRNSIAAGAARPPLALPRTWCLLCTLVSAACWPRRAAERQPDC